MSLFLLFLFTLNKRENTPDDKKQLEQTNSEKHNELINFDWWGWWGAKIKSYTHSHSFPRIKMCGKLTPMQSAAVPIVTCSTPQDSNWVHHSVFSVFATLRGIGMTYSNQTIVVYSRIVENTFSFPAEIWNSTQQWQFHSLCCRIQLSLGCWAPR